MIKTILIEKDSKVVQMLENRLKQFKDIDLGEIADDFSKDFDYENTDLIIFELNTKNYDFYKQLKEKYPRIHFISLYDNCCLEKVNISSVENVILKPFIIEIFDRFIDEIRNKMNNKKINLANTISLFSPLEQTGKSTLCLNLALELLRKTKKKVLIVDFSQKKDIEKYLNWQKNENDQFLKSCFDFDGENLELYLLNFEKLPDEISKTLAQLKQQFDFILIDTPRLIYEKTFEILVASDLVLYNCLLNSDNIQNCKKCYELFDKINYNDDKIKLIINRFSRNLINMIDEFENALNRRVFNTISNNFLVLDDSFSQKIPLFKTNPNSDIFKSYSKIADDILKIDFESLRKDSKINFDNGFYSLLKRMGE